MNSVFVTDPLITRTAPAKTLSSATHCAVCLGQDFQPVSDHDRHGKPLSTVLCRGCGLVFTHPRPTPDEIRNFYRDSYRVVYKQAHQPSARHTYRAGRVALERLAYLRPLLHPGCRVLDLGAGGGELLYMLKGLGQEVSGIEPNEGYGQFASEVLGLPVQVGEYQTAVVEPGSQDVVTAFHVVEHLEEPVEAMKILAGWLKPGGRLFIEVPNLMSTCQWPASRFHLAHLYHFSPATLAMAGRRAGLVVLDGFTSEDQGNVMAVFERPETPATLPDGKIPGHAERAAALLERHTAWRHALTPGPYLRPFLKLKRRAAERRALAVTHDPRSLLDALLAEAK